MNHCLSIEMRGASATLYVFHHGHSFLRRGGALPSAQFTIIVVARALSFLRDVKTLGEALWYSYDYTIDSPKEHIAGHGMSMCRRDKDRWRILNLHNSFLESPARADSSAPKER